MAIVAYTYEPKPIDATLDTLAQAHPDRLIRCRLQPDIYDYAVANYKTWVGLVWTIDCENVEEGRRLREGLEGFFKAFGGKRQGKLLRQLKVLVEQG